MYILNYSSTTKRRLAKGFQVIRKYDNAEKLRSFSYDGLVIAYTREPIQYIDVLPV